MLPKILNPVSANDLFRLGNKFDGGYVISKKILINTDTLITFGLADEFSFEENFNKLKKNLKIYAFDHTVNNIYWMKYFFKWFWRSIRYRKSFNRAFRFYKYNNFFNNKNIFHFKKKIVPNKNIGNDEISIAEILKKYEINCEKTLLKIDIDMDEYKILDEILNEKFLGIVIEFSYVNKMLEDVINFVKKNNKMSIIHIHGNNFDPPDKNGDPIHLEVTFINNKYLNEQEKSLSTKKYPLKGLDFPNNIMKKDINIEFKNI